MPSNHLVPFAFVLVGRHGVLGVRNGLLAVDPGRDEGGQPARNLLALLAHRVEGPDGTPSRAADLAADIPSAETAVFLAVETPNLVDDVSVVLHLVRHVVRVPVFARVVEPEVELHAVLLGQPQIHVHQVDRGHVAPLPQQVGRGVGDELAVARADQDDRIDADGFHVAEVAVPFALAPVLMGYVVRYSRRGTCR